MSKGKSIPILFFLIILATTNSTYSQMMTTQTRCYTVTSNKVTIGRIDTTEYYSDEKRISDSLTMIDLNERGKDYTLQARSKIEWNNTTLSLFDHWIIEQRAQWHLKGSQIEDSLWVSAYKLKSHNQKNIEELTSLGLTIINCTVPHSGTAMQILSLFSSEESEGEEAVPLDYYTTTDIELPYYLLKQTPWQGTKEIAVFFTDELVKKTVKARFFGIQTVNCSAGDYECSVFETEIDSKLSIVWFTKRPEGKEYLVKQTGTLDKYPYTLLLESIN